MTFTLRKGSSSVVICDGVSQTGTAGKWIGPLGDSAYSCKWHTLAREYIGAADATPQNLGNRQYEVPLRVVAEYASEGAAWASYYALPARLLSDGASLVIVTDNGTTVTYGKAEIEELSASVVGVSVIVDYKFLCNAPTIS